MGHRGALRPETDRGIRSRELRVPAAGSCDHSAPLRCDTGRRMRVRRAVEEDRSAGARCGRYCTVTMRIAFSEPLTNTEMYAGPTDAIL